MPRPAQPDYLTVPRAAGMLGVSPRTLGRLLDEGRIDFIQPSVHRRVSLTSLLHYRERQARGRRKMRVLELADDPLRD